MRGGGKPAGSCLPSVQPTRLPARSGWPVPPRFSMRGISGDSLLLLHLRRVAAPSLLRRRYFYQAFTAPPFRRTVGILLPVPSLCLSPSAAPTASSSFFFSLETRIRPVSCVCSISSRGFQSVADSVLVLRAAVRPRALALVRQRASHSCPPSHVVPPTLRLSRLLRSDTAGGSE